MTTSLEQIQKEAADAGIVPGAYVSWRPNIGNREWQRFGCVLDAADESGEVGIVASNGEFRLSWLILKLEPEVEDAIVADQKAIYGTDLGVSLACRGGDDEDQAGDVDAARKLTDGQKLLSKRRVYEELQRAVNLVSNPASQAMIEAIAVAIHAPYPQYQGYWANWRLVRVLRQVETKAGVSFEKGDKAIADGLVRQGHRTVYSIRTGMNTSVHAGDVESVWPVV